MKTLTLSQSAEIAEFSRVFAEERFGVAVTVKVRPAADRKTLVRRYLISFALASGALLYAGVLLYVITSFAA